MILATRTVSAASSFDAAASTGSHLLQNNSDNHELSLALLAAGSPVTESRLADPTSRANVSNRGKSSKVSKLQYKISKLRHWLPGFH